MPRRNVAILIFAAIFAMLCHSRVDRASRVLAYAMRQIRDRALVPVDQTNLLEGALEGMTSRLDPYSEYITQADLAAFNEEVDQKFGGVGMEVNVDPKTKQLTVISPLVGSPAYEGGIHAGDRILRIDERSTQGLSLADCIDLLQGEPGEPVVLEVLHPGDAEPTTVKLMRTIVHMNNVLGDTRSTDGSWNYFIDGDQRIGYIRITTFGERAGEQTKEAIREAVAAGIQGLILDLRNNPGGLLGAAVEVCDMFIDDGVIVTTRDRHGRVIRALQASEGTICPDIPVVVLVNQFTASAAEIVAACLQDHDRVIVVGERTFGKGTVQELIDLDAGFGLLKLTTAGYWRPSNQNIQRPEDADDEEVWGVSPSPGCAVAVDHGLLGELRRLRGERDICRPKTGKESSDADRLPELDPQWKKGIEVLKSRIR